MMITIQLFTTKPPKHQTVSSFSDRRWNLQQNGCSSMMTLPPRYKRFISHLLIPEKPNEIK